MRAAIFLGTMTACVVGAKSFPLLAAVCMAVTIAAHVGMFVMDLIEENRKFDRECK